MIKIEKTGAPSSILGHIGSVLDVIAAKLPAKITSRKFKASDFAYGFELATPRSLSSLGETVVVNGTCYATSTDKTSPDYNKTIHGPEFVTGGLFLIPHGSKPSHKAHFTGSALPLIDCYNQIYDTIQEPLAFVGLIEFSQFHAAAIGKPPIDEKNIFQHKGNYYPNPDIQKGATFGFIMGAITNYQQKQFSKINKQLEVVLYNNPTEQSSQITYHSHIITLKQPIHSLQEIEPSLVDQTLHLYCEGSVVTACAFDIFTIKELKDYL